MPQFQVTLLHIRRSGPQAGASFATQLSTDAASEAEAEAWGKSQADDLCSAADDFDDSVDVRPLRPAQSELF